MRKWIFALVLVAVSLPAQTPRPAPAARPSPAAANATRPRAPKLVLAIMVDQFRYDYLTRFRADYTAGLKRLLDQGAVFTNARYEHVPTLTAVGHSVLLSGAPPSMSGIVGNDWWDRTTRKVVTSVSDDTTKLLGAEGAGSSPRRLLQSTIGDELKISGKGGKVIGISLKDRSAILPAGHMADGAYWFDGGSGAFVSSTYYFRQVPDWVTGFNHGRPADKFAGHEWMGHKTPAALGPALYNELEYTPYGNELIEQFALRAIEAEKLGAGVKMDLLAVSFSSNDYVGHRMGPDAGEVRDMALRVDKLIGDLIRAAETQAGVGNVLVVLSADHGVAPVPEESAGRKMPGGRLYLGQLRDAVEKGLAARFGAGSWISYINETGIFLNPEWIATRKVSQAEVEAVAADTLRAVPHVARVYTRTQLLNGAVLQDQVARRVANGFNAGRSPEILIIPDAFWIPSLDGVSSGTTHGTPYDYDAHVPVIFLGPQVRPGRYNRNVAPSDIAPTLATLLDVATPSGSIGSVLEEILK